MRLLRTDEFVIEGLVENDFLQMGNNTPNFVAHKDGRRICAPATSKHGDAHMLSMLLARRDSRYTQTNEEMSIAQRMGRYKLIMLLVALWRICGVEINYC